MSIQGARQTGKSFLARELVSQVLPRASYQTFDQQRAKSLAQENPQSFLSKYGDAFPLMIDEAQKVPDIFDAMKYQVDLHPKPGQFLILGSTEFSREVLIKESLTGRLSKTRMYPLCLSETEDLTLNTSKDFALINKKPRVERRHLLKYLDRGGFPGIFAIRDQNERESLYLDWMNLVCERDLLQFKTQKLDSEVALSFLEQVPRLDTPDATHLSKKSNQSLAKTVRHLKALEQLFVLHRLNPHILGSGKPLYFPCDVGLASFLEADFHRQLQTWLLLEQMSQRSYRDLRRTKFSYYRSARGGVIDLVLEDQKTCAAIKILPREKIDLRDFEILKAFGEKYRLANGFVPRLIAIAPTDRIETHGPVSVYPWESVV
ncbi:AAA family ATPase [Bdellovibrionota bacterium FG-2]